MRLPRESCLKMLTAFLSLLSGLAHSASQQVDIMLVVNGNISFACDLYARLRVKPDNIFFSPFSISTCLAMTYAGARGETAKQMARLLHLQTNNTLLHNSLGELQRQFKQEQRSGIELSIANALWAQEGHPFLSSFLGIARTQYEAELRQVDFETAADSVASQISTWISQKTKGRIENMLGPDSLDPSVRLVLANAIYFKGTWAHTFDKTATALQPFYISPSNKVDVRLMHHLDRVRYVQSETFQAVELPYSGGALTMVIFLPRKTSELAQVESWLTPLFISRWFGQMQSSEVEILLPNFNMTTSLDLGSELSKMGMKDAFLPGADFSGVDGDKDLFLSKVLHKAWVEVNEVGTEAAAATAAIAITSSAVQPPPPPVFRADHPFVFLIREARSGSILFLGRLMEPGK